LTFCQKVPETQNIFLGYSLEKSLKFQAEKYLHRAALYIGKKWRKVKETEKSFYENVV